MDTVDEWSASVGCDVGRENKDNTSIESSRARVNSSKIGASKEALAEEKRRGRREEKRGEEGSTKLSSSHGVWTRRLVKEESWES